jgi:hypothetical protein
VAGTSRKNQKQTGPGTHGCQETPVRSTEGTAIEPCHTTHMTKHGVGIAWLYARDTCTLDKIKVPLFW